MFDWRWRIKETLVLDTLETQLASDMNKLAHSWHCAAAQLTGWDEDEKLFNTHRKLAGESYNLIGRATLPWYNTWSAGDDELAKMWREFKEREKDPVYAAELKALREKMNKDAADAEAYAKAGEAAVQKAKEESAKRQRDYEERARRRNARLRR